MTDYQYFKHGEAIVYGIRFAAWLSYQSEHLPQSEFERIEILLKQFQIPDLPKNIKSDELIDKTGMDKKQTREGLHFVCLEEIGRTKVEPISDLSDHITEWLYYVQS